MRPRTSLSSMTYSFLLLALWVGSLATPRQRTSPPRGLHHRVCAPLLAGRRAGTAPPSKAGLLAEALRSRTYARGAIMGVRGRRAFRTPQASPHYLISSYS